MWICATCGNHYPEAPSPPGACVICADERQWVPASGQRWTTIEELRAAGHRGEVRELEPGLVGIGVDPPFAIGQRALLVRTPAGNLLWDPPGFLDQRQIQAVGDAGGLRAVTPGGGAPRGWYRLVVIASSGACAPASPCAGRPAR